MTNNTSTIESPTTEVVAREHPAVTGYDPVVRFYASRYIQGGRVTYSLDLSLAQVAGLLPAPDPTTPQPGNRRIQPQHAAAFGQYVRTNRNWVAPALMLRGTSDFTFDVIEEVEGTQFGVISLPFLALTDIHILDGQHRILGIHMALRAIANETEKTRTLLNRIEKRAASDDQAEEEARQAQISELRDKLESLKTQRFRFEHERTSVQMVIEDEQLAYQQMFYDIADNALNITASVRARFDTRKAVNRVLQDVLTHELLMNRVDLESDRLGRNNPNFLSAKHVADIIRIQAVGVGGRIGRRVESDLNETELMDQTYQFFNALLEFKQLEGILKGTEDPAELRTHAMVASPVTIRVLAGVYAELRKGGFPQARIKRFFRDLDPFLSRPASKEWVENTNAGLFFEGGLAPTSRRQDVVALVQTLKSWAIKRPDWMKK